MSIYENTANQKPYVYPEVTDAVVRVIELEAGNGHMPARASG
jgi:hypothetical protein